MTKLEKIRLLEIFSGVKEETLEQIAQKGKISEIEKGAVFLRAKEPATNICIQLSGKSIIYNLTHDGKRKILFICGKGMLLNEHVFNDHATSMYCETIEKSRIFMIPCREFIEIMQADFKLAKNVMGIQEKKIWRLSHQLKNTMSSIYLERKLAAKLWKLARDFGIQTEEGIEIDVNMTASFLADMLGVSRETTSRTCATLVENGLIMIRKKRIVIENPEKMSAFYKTGKII